MYHAFCRMLGIQFWWNLLDFMRHGNLYKGYSRPHWYSTFIREQPRIMAKILDCVDRKYPFYQSPRDICYFIFQRGMAEREGFEPSIPIQVYWFSRPAHSTTLPPLRLRRKVLEYCSFEKEYERNLFNSI